MLSRRRNGNKMTFAIRQGIAYIDDVAYLDAAVEFSGPITVLPSNNIIVFGTRHMRIPTKGPYILSVAWGSATHSINRDHGLPSNNGDDVPWYEESDAAELAVFLENNLVNVMNWGDNILGWATPQQVRVILADMNGPLTDQYNEMISEALEDDEEDEYFEEEGDL